MRVLVTGGAGFIGSSVVRRALKGGAQVVVLDDLSTGYAENLDGLAVGLVRGDVRDAAAVAGAVAGCDVVFHLAASIGNVKSLADPRLDADVNVLGTITVLEAARKAGVRRFVYSSSAAIFGELVTMPIAEDHPQSPVSPYGVSKLAAEKYALCFGGLYGVRTVCLRYFNVYGVRQRYDAYGNVIPIFAQRLAEGRPLTIYGDGEQTRDFVNVEDVAAANWLAATCESASGVFNIGSGSSITVNRLIDLMVDAFGIKPVAVKHDAPRPAEVRHCMAETGKARREMGYEPQKSMAEGLQSYMDWFVSTRK
jgi:UDP-glucose 4-epimerase